MQVARPFVTGVLVLVLFQLARPHAFAASPNCGPQPRAQDTVWLVNSRPLGSCDLESNATRLKYWRFDREKSWTPSNLAELTATDDSGATTIVFLHGNRIDYCEAFIKGWIAYRQLVKCASERPVRFVIWSWPSEKVCGPIEDAREKAARTDPAGYYLAWFLDRLDPEIPVSLWGHSFGARIATGALHVLGGGAIAGHRLEARVHAVRRPVQVVLLAAALDDHWLFPGHHHGEALPQTQGMLLVNNGCDRLLKRYHLIYCRRSCAEALGYVGLARGCLPAEQASKVSQIDACCYVGKQHVFANYIASPALMARMRATLLFESPAAPPASTARKQTGDKPLVELVMQ